MAGFVTQVLAFNRGIISDLALARVDLKRMALSASIMVNWMTRVLGSMMLRPGLGFLHSTLNDSPVVHVDFLFGTDDTALIELTAGNMRVVVNDVIVARPAVTSMFNDWDGGMFVAGMSTASTFDDSADVDLWAPNDEAGGASGWAAPGYMSLMGDGTNAGIRDRSINVVGANIGLEHALAIVVVRGNATIRIGSTLGLDDYLEDRLLRQGVHSIAITPTGPFFVRLSASDDTATLIDSVIINQTASDMVLPAPWQASNLDDIRWDQSGDVVFLGCFGVAQKRIERQDRTSVPPSRSWSIVDYLPPDGPFGPLNVGPILLKCSVISGDGVLTASKSYFKPTHVGALFRLTSSGQEVDKHITSENVFTDPIKVTGVGTDRSFTLELDGPTFTGSTTATLQRSLATPGSWTDQTTYTAPQTTAFNDTLDNQIVYYRLGVKTGDFTLGDDITAKLTFATGSIDGVCRVNEYLTPTTMGCSVLKDMGAADTFTQDWYEGDWSPRKGFPSSVALFDGRLWWAGKSLIWGSTSDLFDGFDESGDTVATTTIRRTLGSGPVDKANWMLALNNLLVGTPGAVQVAKANSIDDPLTPTAFSLKPVTTFGCMPMRSAVIDTNGVYVARNGSKVYQLSADANLYTLVPYVPTELTATVPEIGGDDPAGAVHFVRIAVQRAIDTRVHLVRSDGIACLLIFDKNENVTCWLNIQTDGLIEDVVALPGVPGNSKEDQVYYTVNRTIGGVTKRYVEKWALERQARGGTDNRIADSHVIYSGAPTTRIPVPHLIGKSVVVWADGICPAANRNAPPTQYLVGEDGFITLDVAASYAVSGLPYVADWQSATIAEGSQTGAPLAEMKIINGIGLVMRNVHARGVYFGQDFDHLTSLPAREDGARVDPDMVYDQYTMRKMPVDGTWNEDARVCLRATAPRPCTVLGMIVEGIGHDNV